MRRQLILFISVCICFLIAGEVEASKQNISNRYKTNHYYIDAYFAEKKKPKAKKETRHITERLPPKVDANLLCLACQVMLRETLIELKGKRTEADVVEVMSYICT